MLATMHGDISEAEGATETANSSRITPRAAIIRRASQRRFAFAIALAVALDGGLGFSAALLDIFPRLPETDPEKPLWIDLSTPVEATAPSPSLAGLRPGPPAPSRAQHTPIAGPAPPPTPVPAPAPLSPSPAPPSAPSTAAPALSSATASPPSPAAPTSPVAASSLAAAAAIAETATPHSSSPASPSQSGQSGAATGPDGITGPAGATGQTGVAGPAFVAGERERITAQLSTYIEAHKTYPEAARRRGAEGTVRITATIDAHGNPLRIVITYGSGSRLLDEAALAALRAAFPVARQGSAPLDLDLAIHYSLRSASP